MDKKKYYTEANKQAAYRYKAKSVKRVPLDMQIEDYEALQVAAKASGESVNGYIKDAIRQKMARG